MTASLVSREDRYLARVATEIPRVPWQVFTDERFRWNHGEHVAMIGPTGQGKTTMLARILPKHPYSVLFVTKPRDRSLDAFSNAGFATLDRWRSMDPRIMPRRILWPDARGLRAQADQQHAFSEAMDKIYREGAWTVSLDELWYFSNRLKLGEDVKTYLTQARSLDISMVNLTQRPAWVPTELYDQSTHIFLWRNNDGRAQQRLSEINAVDHDLVRYTVARLDPHQTLYVNTRTGEMCRTRCPQITRGEVSLS